MKKVMCVVGCRPDAIKMMPLIIELNKRKNIDVKLLSTGQHKQMLETVFKEFGVFPDYDLQIMRSGQSLFGITTSILSSIENIFNNDKPDIVLVHGDTTTAFTVALAAYYKRIPVGHVEAGLRTNDIYSPYPEEFNRQSISLLAKYHFAPTKLAKDNLIAEGKSSRNIWVTGNTVIDAMRYTVTDYYTHPEIEWAKDSKMIFITAHRRENLGDPMRNMFRAIRRVLDEHNDVKAIYPIHMNPIIRQIANEELRDCERLHIIEPINVFDCHNFEAQCYLCLTDSGGIQEECPTYGKPVLVMRDTTERPEGVEAGTLKLVGTNEETIYNEFKKLLENKYEYEKMSGINNPYGDGNACKRIADIIEFGNCDEFMV